MAFQYKLKLAVAVALSGFALPGLAQQDGPWPGPGPGSYSNGARGGMGQPFMFGGMGNSVSEHRLASGHRVLEGTHSMPGGGTLHAWRYGHGLTGVVERPIKPGYSNRTYVRGGRVLYARVYHQNTFQRYGRSYSYQQLVPAVGFGVAYYAWAARPWSAPVTYRWQWDAEPWHRAYGNGFTPYSNYSSLDQWLTDYLVAESLRNAYENWQAENTPADQSGSIRGSAAGAGASNTGPRPYWDTPDNGQRPDWDVPDNRKPYWEEQGAQTDSSVQPNDGQSEGGKSNRPQSDNNHSAGGHSAEDQPDGNRSAGAHSAGAEPVGNHPAGAKSNGVQPNGAKKGGPAGSNTHGPQAAGSQAAGSQARPVTDDSPPQLPQQVKAELNAQIKRQLAERQTPTASGATDLPDSLKPGHTLFRVSTPLDVASKGAGQLCSLRANDYIERTGDMDQNGMVPVKVKVGGASDCSIGLLTKVSVNDLEAMDSEQQQALTDALLAASKNMGSRGLPQAPGTTPVLLAAGQANPSSDATQALGQLQ